MTNINQQILKQISNITFSDGSKISDLISNVVIKGQDIGFSINIQSHDRQEAEQIRELVINKLKQLPNISKVTVVLTKEVSSAANVKHLIDEVKNIILIASGKGGVGKSTITTLLAEQLTISGYRVGIVDTDIYGPSIPQMFDLNNKPTILNKKFVPLCKRDIQIMSIGVLVNNDNAISWRGPMASKAIYQLFSLTAWRNLDYLIVDTPPGTGDIHLAMLKNYHINGAIIITTPQEISRLDVQKTVNLYKSFNIPILGIIENMCYLMHHNGEKMQIFAGDSGEHLAQKYNAPLICKLPILPALAAACDRGRSLVNIMHLPIEQVVNYHLK